MQNIPATILTPTPAEVEAALQSLIEQMQEAHRKNEAAQADIDRLRDESAQTARRNEAEMQELHRLMAGFDVAR